jgi:3'-5' exonuclease
MAAYRVFDIETVVDDRFWTPPEAKWTLRPIEHLVQKADGTLGHSVNELLRDGFLWREEPFPPPQAHRVVAIACVELSGDDGEWYKLTRATGGCVWSHGDDADALEKNILEQFGEVQKQDGALLVTWNGRTFDLPVVNLRSFLHGVPCPWYYEERDVRYRYTEAGHCDLMDVFSDYGAARSMKLGDVARLLGLPGKVGPVTGANVGDIYGKGNDLMNDMADVAKYCLGDALQTALLFAKHRAHKGMIDVDHYRRVVLPSFLPELERVLGVKESDLR